MATEITQENIVVTTLPTGHALDLTVYQVTGDHPGPHVHLQASVHGSELQGSLLLFQLLEHIKEVELCGTLTIIPLANPLATNNKQSTFTQGRYSQVTGDNWNRLYHDVTPELDLVNWLKSADHSNLRQAFKQHLQKTLQTNIKRQQDYGLPHNMLVSSLLQERAAHADIVLDLHTGPCATQYLYAPVHLQKQAKDLGLPYHILIPSAFAGAMDEACFTPWFHFEQLCQERKLPCGQPFEAYTLELGSEEFIDSELADQQLASLLFYFHQRGIVKSDGAPQKVVQRPLDAFKSYYLPRGGLVEYLKKPGESIKQGEPLYLLHVPHEGTLTVQANGDAHVINHTPSAALLQGTCVYQVLEI